MDKSDENECNIIIIDGSSYRKEQPPAHPNENQHLNIRISFDIFKISKFLEVGNSFNIKFLISITWYDNRIKFADLKDNIFKNVIGSNFKQLLWTPPLIFNNSEDTTMLSINRDADQPIVNMFVEKEGHFEVADPSHLHEAYFYKGFENPLVLSTEYNLVLHCNYKLQDYPFDTQVCNIEVSIVLKYGDYYKICNNYHIMISVSYFPCIS